MELRAFAGAGLGGALGASLALVSASDARVAAGDAGACLLHVPPAGAAGPSAPRVELLSVHRCAPPVPARPCPTPGAKKGVALSCWTGMRCLPLPAPAKLLFCVLRGSRAGSWLQRPAAADAERPPYRRPLLPDERPPLADAARDVGPHRSGEAAPHDQDPPDMAAEGAGGAPAPATAALALASVRGATLAADEGDLTLPWLRRLAALVAVGYAAEPAPDAPAPAPLDLTLHLQVTACGVVPRCGLRNPVYRLTAESAGLSTYPWQSCAQRSTSAMHWLPLIAPLPQTLSCVDTRGAACPPFRTAGCGTSRGRLRTAAPAPLRRARPWRRRCCWAARMCTCSRATRAWCGPPRSSRSATAPHGCRHPSVACLLCVVRACMHVAVPGRRPHSWLSTYCQKKLLTACAVRWACL